mmetsp:Transcript_94753/g.116052  ORF Transcript_94753/g.116052 Transcript_94753/m.116052 type:complete len:111 (+) Transcript_94753:63-395(+)
MAEAKDGNSTTKSVSLSNNVVKDLFTFDDLKALHSSPDRIREAFKQYYGIYPDGIAINKETYYNAVKPAITEEYGYPCYKTLGKAIYKIAESRKDTVIIGVNYAENRSDT